MKTRIHKGIKISDINHVIGATKTVYFAQNNVLMTVKVKMKQKRLGLIQK